MYKKEGVNTFFGANSYIIPKINRKLDQKFPKIIQNGE